MSSCFSVLRILHSFQAPHLFIYQHKINVSHIFFLLCNSRHLWAAIDILITPHECFTIRPANPFYRGLTRHQRLPAWPLSPLCGRQCDLSHLCASQACGPRRVPAPDWWSYRRGGGGVGTASRRPSSLTWGGSTWLPSYLGGLGPGSKVIERAGGKRFETKPLTFCRVVMLTSGKAKIPPADISRGVCAVFIHVEWVERHAALIEPQNQRSEKAWSCPKKQYLDKLTCFQRTHIPLPSKLICLPIAGVMVSSI